MAQNHRPIEQQNVGRGALIVNVDVEPIGARESVPTFLLDEDAVPKGECGPQQIPALRPFGWTNDADAEICRECGSRKH